MLENIRSTLEAISFATRKHRAQLRKDGATPYASHPCRVAMLLVTVFRVEDPEVLAAAALHDTIEDTTADHDELTERFGARVADWVALLSKDKRLPEPERERLYFERLLSAPLEVKLCKLGDTLDNLIDAKNISDAGRHKAMGKAAELLAAFEPEFPSRWAHAIAAVRSQLELMAPP